MYALKHQNATHINIFFRNNQYFTRYIVLVSINLHAWKQFRVVFHHFFLSEEHLVEIFWTNITPHLWWWNLVCLNVTYESYAELIASNSHYFTIISIFIFLFNFLSVLISEIYKYICRLLKYIQIHVNCQKTLRSLKVYCNEVYPSTVSIKVF